MKTLFLGGLAARVAPRILGKNDRKARPTVLAELTDMQRLIPTLAEAEIVVGHIWRSDFPEAPRLKLLQAATAGVDMIDLRHCRAASPCATSSVTNRRSPNMC